MAGDPSKASLWADADVYIAPVGTALPATALTPWSSAPGWRLVGLLDGDAGFAHNRSQDKTDHFAWGQILVRSSKKNFKTSVQFSVLEDNDATRDLVWPGSTASTLKVPTPVPMMLALELREGTRVKRLITALHAEATSDSYTETESDLTTYPITADIFPNGNKELWTVQDSGADDVTALAITGTPPTTVGRIARLTATATFTVAGAVDVSALAEWSSSAPLDASAEGPYVTALGTGTTPTITASFGGKSDNVALNIS